MLWFILILISAVVFGLPFGMFVAWCVNCHDYAKIKYKDFRKYYNEKPSRWYCYEYRVIYHRYNTDMHESFNFGFIDFCRYTLWQIKLAKAEKHKRRIESMQRFLDDVNKTEAENG